MVQTFLDLADQKAVVVVIACSWVWAAKLVHAEPTLTTALQWHVDISDFEPHKLKQIAVAYAEGRECGLTVSTAINNVGSNGDDGNDLLTQHFADAIESGMLSGNCHYAHQFIDKADRRREDRAFSLNGTQENLLVCCFTSGMCRKQQVKMMFLCFNVLSGD